MARRPFVKPTLTLDDQIAHLKAKGMVFADENWAKQQLQHISYYRLSAYWLPFEYPKAAQTPTHCFRPGTSFETVAALHEFDCKLRRLVSEAIEAFEIALRGNWAHALAMLGNGHSYLETAHYSELDKFVENSAHLVRDIKRSKERFVKNYRDNHTPSFPPVWMIAEILSFGSLSHWYANLKEASVRQVIADPFGLDERVFKPLIHHLTVVRNICAHHSRLWNRQIPVALRLPNNPANLGQSMNTTIPKGLYNTLTVLAFVLNEINALPNWQGRLLTHLDSLPHGNLGQLGFPQNYEALPIWSRVARI